MKKLVTLITFISIGLGLFGGNQTHASNCQEMTFNDAVLCIGIEKNSSTSYTVFRNITQSSSNLAIACDIFLPNGNLRMVGSCNGNFSYNGSSIGPVKLYVKVNNQYKTLEATYNFNLGERTNTRNNDNDRDNDDRYGPSQLDEFSLSKNPSSPNRNQRIDVTIRARNSNNSTITNYDETVEFSVQYRSNNSSYRQNAPSSYYSLDRSSYNFSTWDNGSVTLNDLVRFTNSSYDYRLVVRERNSNVTDYWYVCYTSNCTTNNNNNAFLSSERSRIQGIHTLWPSLINDLETEYSLLRFNNSWQNTQDDLYEEMGKIVYGGNSIYNNYSSFYNAFIDWYSLTIQLVR